jgi:hypothetical protein
VARFCRRMTKAEMRLFGHGHEFSELGRHYFVGPVRLHRSK